MSDILKRVHVTTEEVASLELTPPHEKRVETAVYKKSHHFLVVEQDRPCEVCGVRNSTLGDPAQNPFCAQGIETHHYPIERSLADACDPLKVHRIAPAVIDQESFMAWVDSPGNLRTLCDFHHRSKKQGIHHLLSQDFAVLPYLRDGYIIASDSKEGQADEATDQQIMDHIVELIRDTPPKEQP